MNEEMRDGSNHVTGELPQRRRPGRTAYGFTLAIVAATYYFTARFGLSLGLTTHQITAVWAPTGIALASFLLFDFHIWPAIAAAAFIVNWQFDEPIHTAFVIAIGNTCEAAVGAGLLRRLFGFDSRMERVRDVLGLAVLGAMLASMVSATIGVSSLALAGKLPPDSLRHAWLKWWLGDATGALVVAPLILTWGSSGLHFRLRHRTPELLLLVAGLLVVSGFIFTRPSNRPSGLEYLVFPFFIWSALRFEQRVSAALVLCVATLAVRTAAETINTVSPGTLDDQLLLQQMFMAVLAVTSLSLGAAIAEGRKIERAHEHLLRREQAALAKSRDLLEEVQKYQERLEHLVRERTEALAGSMERLRRTERLASLGTLAAGIAHEINNPLNTILLSAEYALIATEEERETALQDIKHEAKRGGQIVKSILDFSRERQTQKVAEDLNEVVTRATHHAKTYTNSKEIAITLDLASDLPPILMNAMEIEQVITNLVKNAVEAGHEAVNVTLRTRREGGQAILGIRDNGRGIPKEHLGRIFDPFYSTRVGVGGTGLGLSICHSIITSHGGTIEVQSEPGQGAEFTIKLPINTSN